jgi:cytochrome c peroxidase
MSFGVDMNQDLNPARRKRKYLRPGVSAACLSMAAAAALVASLSLGSQDVFAGGTVVQPVEPVAPVDAPPVPEGLKGIPVPKPSNLSHFVANEAAAVRLGKALFWDMQVGSDGKTACASCHFHGGADSRSKNQVSPGLLRVSSPGNPNPDTTFQVGGPNYQFKPDDFPFHKFADPSNRNSQVVRTHNDVASSMGVFKSTFLNVTPGASQDTFNLAGDPIFNKDGLQTRQVEPRNTPSMINSIFNFRNFWDGRATFLFNGVSPFGAFDNNARVYRAGTTTSAVSPVTVRIDHASLASLATGPALSDLEMSAAGRTWPKIGVRLLAARPLAQQRVDSTDSVLASVRHTSGTGLNDTYLRMVQAAFRPEWWQGTAQVNIAGTNYTQAQANFSLFFGLAIQMYGATLVSDDSPFDRHMAGDNHALSTSARQGLAIFFGKGKCANCHGGAEFTNASVRKVKKEAMSRMIMGNGGRAVYDEGFYNISIGKTLDDIANGANNPVGRPMSLTKLAQQVGSAEFERLIGIPANVTVASGERIAVNGAFKTPSIRNAELTAPYFHNGSVLTLDQLVEFYNRGGNHFNNNIADVDPDIQPLGLTADERRWLVDFIKSTTDERVRLKRAPFDHPQLLVPNGHEVDNAGRLVNENGRAKDAMIEIPAVGRGGLAQPQPNFLDGIKSNYFSLVANHSGKCVDVAGASTSAGGNVYQWSCHGGDNQLWEEVPTAGGFLLKNKNSGMCMDVSGISYAQGANIYQWTCHGGPNQVFNWSNSRLVVSHSRQCAAVVNNTADGANIAQWSCANTVANAQFTKR